MYDFFVGKFVDYLESFIHAAREKRVVIRPFKYDKSKSGGIDGQIEAANAAVQKMQTQLKSWCRTHFGEVNWSVCR